MARLTGANGLLVLSALITGPIQARALGPSGRGAIAIIVTVTILAPFILDLGLSDYVTRERARGRRLGDLLGTMLPIAWVMSLVGVAAAVPTSNLLGGGDNTVALFVRIGLMISPFGVTGLILYGAARGAQQWSLVYHQRIAVAVIPAVGLIFLAIFDLVTVTSASVLMLTSGFAALGMIAPALRGGQPWRWRRCLIGDGLRFGLRSWIATLSTAGNARLDQVIMAPLVATREIGFYAVAVSVTGIVSTFTAAVMTALMPRVAAGESDAFPRASRIASGLLILSLLAIGGLSPLAVPLVFGGSFRPAVPMITVLLIATYTFGMSTVIGSSLQGAGRPQDSMRAQLTGLVVTLCGLPLLLPPLGGLGAAIVSSAAGTVTFLVTGHYARRAFAAPARSLLIPRMAELGDVLRRLPAPGRHS